MRSIWIVGATAVLAVTVTACSNSGKPAASPTPAGVVIKATPSATPSATGSPSSVVTTIDPCQLVTQQEASTLTGASFGPGKEESEPGGGKRCIYGYQTKNVFTVIVVQAASVAQARAEKDALRAEAEKELGAQLALTRVSGVGDDAETAHMAGLIPVGAIYVLKGTVGFGLVDVTGGASPPSQASLITLAGTVLSRLP